MQHTLIAVFDNRADAQGAMSELLGAGFDRSKVRVSEDNNMPTQSANTSNNGNSADEGMGSSIKHFFSDLFGDTTHVDQVHKYSTALDRGHHAVTVIAANEAEVERAADIVERFNPIDIDEKAAEWDSVSSTAAPATWPDASTAQAGKTVAALGAHSSTGASNTISVVQEELKVGKREVQRGGVRVYSRIIETPVQENVSLREEHVNVERRPVDQMIDAGDSTAFKEQTIELRATGEEAVVQKTAHVVEEVIVSKAVSERQENITDTLRHTEVNVEQLGTQSALNDSSYRNHFAKTYSNTGKHYDDYSPAYSYGNDMAAKYQGRQWNEVEADVRSNWESRHSSSDGSTWDEFKDAIRNGWDSITK